MKHFKILIGILLVLFSHASTAGIYKCPPAEVLAQIVQSPVYCASKIAKTKFYDTYLSKKLDIHYKIKNNVRCRATAAESNILTTPYYSNLLRFIIYKSSLLYGVSIIYQLKRCSYLHLYKLF